MDLDQNFQQRWDYRRKDDGIDSSSDDSMSSLGNEPVRKKHKPVSKLKLSQECEAIDGSNSQQKNQVDAATKRAHFQVAEVTQKHLERGKKKIANDNKSTRKSGKMRKRNVSNPIQDQDPSLVNDLKVFTESLLKDLKAAREKMFVQMKERMTKLVAAKPGSRQKRSRCLKKSEGAAIHQKGNKSGTKIQSCDGGLKKGSKKDNLVFDSRKCCEDRRERTNHEKLALESNKMDKTETLPLPGNKLIHLVKDSDQVGSSSYLTLPAGLPKPQTETPSTDSHFRDHIEGKVSVNSSKTAERENVAVDADNHYSYLLGIQQDEQFGSFAQITSKTTCFFDQQSSQTSSMISSLPVTLHQWPNNGFNITSQSALTNPAQENNTRNPRMNGGASVRALT